MTKPASTLNEAQLRFLDDLTTLLANWNFPANAARVYGYLLLREDPASLDEISADLSISKSNASGAAKMLESWGHCRRTRDSSTKRLYYEINENHGVTFLSRMRLLQDEQALMEDAAARVARGKPAKRLQTLADFCDRMSKAMETVISGKG